MATVAEAKITRYLLNPLHPVGGSKAVFFLRFGFNALAWQRLAWALRTHAVENEVSEKEETRYGVRYEINGRMTAPDGSVLNVRSAWFIDAGSEKPRFITAHPLPKL